jgi:hypothetical protein
VLVTIESTLLAGRSFAATGSIETACKTAQRGNPMKNPLDSLWGTIISGLVLTVILYFVVKSILG